MPWYPDLLIPTTIVLCMYLSFWMKYESHFKFLNIYVSKLFQYSTGLPSFLDLCKKVCKFWATKIPLLWGTSNLKMSGFTWLSWCSQLQMLFCFCQKPQFSISLQNHNGMISFLRCILIFVPIWCVYVLVSINEVIFKIDWFHTFF